MRHFSFEKIEPFDGPMLIYPLLAEDERGYVLKDYHEEMFLSHGICHPLREVFYTSSKQGVVRAIHFQVVKPQGKLVRCVSGKIYDVIVDLRVDSPTYKEWMGFELTPEGPQLYIPHGFGHGYLVLEDSIVSYKCDEKFYSEYDSGVKWNDKCLNIDWPVELVETIVLSKKDEEMQDLRTYEQSGHEFRL